MGDQIGTSLEGALYFVPKRVFDRVRALPLSRHERARLVADLCRINVLYMIARAGSGHIGSSFSSLDIMSWLFLEELDNAAPNVDGALYFSSKGHDAPALYALLIALGRLPEASLHALRRLGGLPGHPDVGTPSILANTGSLGMGISKAKGMIHAQRARGERRRVFVLTGDGELQEGQIWESLASAVRYEMTELTVIVDHNKLQSDSYVCDTSDLGDLAAKFASFGWRVSRIDGHSAQALDEALHAQSSDRRPHVVVADTIKGRGVSFMQPPARGDEPVLYRYHSGAPDGSTYRRALLELSQRIGAFLDELGAGPLLLEPVETPARAHAVERAAPRLIDSYSRALLEWLERRADLMVLDADLALDMGLWPVKQRHPQRFIECGIAEMDMVSQAGGLARRGMLPICHSFACFLSARPNEHIYNNASENSQVIYCAGLAGLLPAGPGHSHQGVRDIAALSGVPGLLMLQPCNELELGLVLRHALEVHARSTYLRLCSLPWQLPCVLPRDYALTEGRGVSVRHGADALIIAYGPVMLSQAFWAAERLAERHGIELEVVNLPWLNRVDGAWLRKLLGARRWLFTLDDHYLAGGQGQLIAASLLEQGGGHVELRRFGLSELPACGSHAEVLRHHGLDADSLCRAIALSMAAAGSRAHAGEVRHTL
jgi:transketolase